MKLKLIKKIKEADSIKTFVFEKPNDFTFFPGQFTYLTLPKLIFPDERGPVRVFTISSSPTEKKLTITTKIRKDSGFKRTLDKIKIGETLELKKPAGNFVIYKKSKKTYIFLAGGIGITPFRSIIKYHQDKKTENRIHLIWSVKTIKEIPFGKEIENWQKEEFIKIDITLTEKVPRNWRGLKGRINKEMIKKLITKKDLQKIEFWICGPPAFVNAMEEILLNLKVKEQNIISEKFTGY